MSFRLSRGSARRISIALLAVSAGILTVLVAVPSVRKSDLSDNRMSTYRIPKRKLAPFAREFASPLPILEIVIAEDSLPLPNEEPISSLMRVYDRSGGNRLTDTPRALLPFVWVRYRGASSMHPHFRQHSIRLKIRDGKQKPSRFDLCGFAPDDDFALIATCMDRSLIRDRMAYELAAPLIPFTPKAKYVEVFVRKADARLDETTYSGIYLAVEPIEEGRHRVAVGPLEIAEPSEGLEGGGWIVKSDRFATNRPTFWIGGESMAIVAPGSRDLAPEVLDFIQADFGRFHRMIREDPLNDQLFDLLDMDSFIDMMLFQEAIKNKDAFCFSTFFHRAAGGRLVAGPPWDFNLSMGNAREIPSPEGFILQERPYSRELLRNPRMFRLYRERWRELRHPGGAFSDGRILELIDSVVTELEPAAHHHYERYRELLRPERQFAFTATYPVHSFEEHVRIVRDFLLRRARWMDGALAAMKGPEDLFSEGAEQTETEAEAIGTAWWNESESPPLRKRP